MGQLGDLLLHGLDYLVVGVANCGHADARTEVNKAVAVNVGDQRAVGVVDVDRQGSTHTVRDLF